MKKVKSSTILLTTAVLLLATVGAFAGGTTGAATTAKPGTTGAATTAKPGTTGAATSAKPGTTGAGTSAKPGTTGAATTAKPGTTGAGTSAKPGTTGAATSASAIPSTAATTQQQPTTFDSNVDPSAPAVPEKQCFFPFWFNNTWQHVCKTYSTSGSRWCSLSKNFTKDEDWKMCHHNDLKRFKCHIPFKYNGTLHRKCLPIPGTEGGSTTKGAHHSFWCSLHPELKNWVAGSSDWAYCESPNATSVEYLKTAEATSGYAGRHSGESDGGELVSAPMKDSASAGAGAGGSGSQVAGAGGQLVVGLTVGAVCSVLAVLAVLAAFAARRRRRRRGVALLSDDNGSGGSDPGNYGGVEAAN